MANTARKAIMTALIEGALNDIFPETKAEYVTLSDGTKLYDKIQSIVEELSSKVAAEPGKGLSAEDFTAAFKAKLEGIAAGAQVNVIEKVSVNGVEQTITDKGVDIKMPTKVSELSNDSKYQTEEQVNAKISSVYKPGGSVAFASLPTAAEGVLGMVYNVTDGFTTDAKFVEGAGKSYPAGTNVVVVAVDNGYKYDVLAGFVDLTDYVKSEEIADVVSAKHTHDNKTVLDGISAAKVAAWDGKARVIASATQPEDLTANDLWLRLAD